MRILESLGDAMEPRSNGIHRLLVHCPIAPAAITPQHREETPAEGATEREEATARAGTAAAAAAAADAARPATGAEKTAEEPPLALKHSYHFVSETDVAAFLLLHVDALGDVAQRTVEQLGLADPLFPPLAIVSSITVTAALRLMQRAGGVRAVAVVARSAEEEERMEEGEGYGASSAADAGAGDGAGGRGGGGGGPGRGRERGEAGWARGGRLLGLLSVSDLRGMDAVTLAQLTSMKVRVAPLTCASNPPNPQARDFRAHMTSLSPEGHRPSITCCMAAPLAKEMAVAAT
ncbi:unnamed protein product [Closterium sp. NIES-65]|nr:unnamed protein product [Closterium sp. NIES-65]